jgi:Tol biopolymer transport system component
VSTDGRYVAFNVAGSPLIASDTNGSADVYIRDRQTNTMTVASLGTGSVQGNGQSYMGVMTPDARYVAFTTYATNFATDTNGVRDAYLRDQMLNTTTRVSLSSTGTQLTAESYAVAVSNDGRYVVFETTDTNVVPATRTGGKTTFCATRS